MNLRLLRLSACLMLGLGTFGCKSDVNGQSFGGSNQLQATLDAARARAAIASKAFHAARASTAGSCKVDHCGESSFLCSVVRAVVSDSSGKRSRELDGHFFPDQEIRSLGEALERATPLITEDASVVTKEGRLKDAVTLGTTIHFYSPAVARMTTDELAALWLHEASHIQGWTDEELLEGFGTVEQAIDARAACLVSHQKSIEAVGSPSVLASHFDRPLEEELALKLVAGAAAAREGKLQPSDTSEFLLRAAMAPIFEGSMRVRALVDFEGGPAPTPAAGWIPIFDRRADGLFQALAAGFWAPEKIVGPELWSFEASQNWKVTIRAPYVSQSVGELRADIVGTAAALYFEGQRIAEATLPRPPKGTVALRGANVSVDYFVVEKLK